jgi:hypothetical protein
VSLPVAKGEPVGRVEVTWRGRLLGGAPAVAGRTVRAAEPSRLAEHLGGLLESVYRALSALGARVR